MDGTALYDQGAIKFLSGLKGNDTMKDPMCGPASVDAQANPPRSPKELIYTEKRTNAMSEAINITLPKEDLPWMFVTSTGTGLKWEKTEQIQ